MQIIKLRINDRIYDRILWFLSKFSKDEVEIILEDGTFLDNQKYLQSELDEIVQGTASFIDFDEANERLEKYISDNENTV